VQNLSRNSQNHNLYVGSSPIALVPGSLEFRK